MKIVTMFFCGFSMFAVSHAGFNNIEIVDCTIVSADKLVADLSSKSCVRKKCKGMGGHIKFGSKQTRCYVRGGWVCHTTAACKG